jgi:hypothetical protein
VEKFHKVMFQEGEDSLVLKGASQAKDTDGFGTFESVVGGDRNWKRDMYQDMIG